MPRVAFTANLRRHLECPPQEVEAATVRDALRQVFAGYPTLEGYIVDERFRLRRHVMIFVDGERIDDRETLSDAVRPESEIYVMQALSGG
jgi:molybdopterin synthase sulfur carrier subunit